MLLSFILYNSVCTLVYVPVEMQDQIKTEQNKGCAIGEFEIFSSILILTCPHFYSVH